MINKSSGTWRGGIARPIIITRPDGTEVEYPSQSAAAKIEPIFQTYISAMCRKHVAMYAGYKARFKED